MSPFIVGQPRGPVWRSLPQPEWFWEQTDQVHPNVLERNADDNQRNERGRAHFLGSVF